MRVIEVYTASFQPDDTNWASLTYFLNPEEAEKFAQEKGKWAANAAVYKSYLVTEDGQSGYITANPEIVVAGDVVRNIILDRLTDEEKEALGVTTPYEL